MHYMQELTEDFPMRDPLLDPDHLELKALVSDLRNAELALARKLAETSREKKYLAYASSMRVYATDWLGLEPEKARKLLTIGKAFDELPELEVAMEAQRVPWTKAFEVARIATADTEARWIEKAEQWSARDLRRAVVASVRGDNPPDEPEQAKVVTLTFPLSQADADVVSTGMSLARCLAPKEAPELSNGEALVLFAETFCAAAASEVKEVSSERFKRVYRQCPTCRSTQRVGSDAESDWQPAPTTMAGNHNVVDAPTDPERAMLDCDALVIDFGPGGGGTARKTVAPRLRRALEERANYRCEVDGCNHRQFLDVHHVVHREHGGEHSLENCTLICSTCHRRAHSGALRIEPAGGGGFSFSWPA